MYQKTKDALRQHHVNTDRYVALHIDKGDIPEGAEVVVAVQDKATGALRQLHTGYPLPTTPAFAQNSRFYKQTMADGHIFHPYLHRRFIAAQFRRLVHQYGCSGIQCGVAHSHTWDYAIGMLRNEVHLLANLETRDRIGFAERSRFFILQRCAAILDSYAVVVAEYIDKCVRRGRDHYCMVGREILYKQNVRPMKHRFAVLAQQAFACKSYTHLDAILSGFQWLSLPRKGLTLPDCFTEPFIEAGAFYTLKHHIMFEGLNLWGLPQQRALETLRTHGGSYLSLYQAVMA